MKKELQLDDYFDGYRSNKLNCIDIPLAACAGYFNRDNYFLYCMLFPIYTNWLCSYNEPWINIRNGILAYLGINIIEIARNDKEIRSSIASGSPLLCIQKYGSLPYSKHYTTGKYDHGIVICGYDANNSTYIIRDREIMRSYIDNGIFSSDVLFRMQITSKQLFTSFKLSDELNKGESDICSKIYKFVNNDEFYREIKELLNSIKKDKNFTSSLYSFIEYRNKAVDDGIYYDKEHIEADRRLYCISYELFMDVCSKFFEFDSDILEQYNTFIKNRTSLIDKIL